MDIGTKRGHHEIRGRLGAGGMGHVYRATDTRLGRDVAVEVLPELISKTFIARSTAMVGFIRTPPLHHWHDRDAENSDLGTPMPLSVAGRVHSITAADRLRRRLSDTPLGRLE